MLPRGHRGNPQLPQQRNVPLLDNYDHHLLNVDQAHNTGHDYVLRVRLSNLREDRALIWDMADHIAALTALAGNTLDNLGRDQYVMTCLLDSNNRINLLEMARDSFNVYRSANAGGLYSRRYFVYDDIVQHFVRSLSDTMDTLATSDTDVDWSEMVFELRFDRMAQIMARGKMKKWLKNTIASNDHTEGLAKYDSSADLCGLQAIVYGLALRQNLRDAFTGDMMWFIEEFAQGNIETRQLTRTKRRFENLARKLGQLIGMQEPFLWNLTMNVHDSSANKFVISQPKYQIAIFNEVTRQLIDVRRGILFDPDNAEDTTFLLSYTLGHLHLITSPLAYFGKAQKNAGEHFCYCCLSYQIRRQHLCKDFDQCDKCLTKFQTASHKKEHCEWEIGGSVCPRCEKRFYNERCYEAHHCRASHVDVCERCEKKIFPSVQHTCGAYKCRCCKEMVDNTHRCFIQMNEEVEPLSAEDVGKSYYAFDLESMLIPIEGTTATRHEVNLVVVRLCFSDEEHVFPNLERFVLWMEEQTHEITLFAHNLKGYDGRIVFDYLFDKHTPPQEVVWRGSKIMKMIYGKISFQDTLLHLPTSLEQMPKMFGLDESQFKKGFFPYKFNTPENQAYDGRVPEMHYFEPDRMKEKKRLEFMNWYAKQADVEYNFQRELLEYCQSDVRILAKSIESYMRQQISNHILNPFDSLTIASYAMRVYRTYYMPEESIARLGRQEHADIAKSMHGGRTDTRRVLKEWTDDEIERGFYGKYQDVQSLYPTVQFYDPLPVGVPRYKHWGNQSQPTAEDIAGFFGFVCCDIEPTSKLFHPILVDVDPQTGRLVADLRAKTEIVIPSPEFHLALANGYLVTKVHWWYEFDSSTELFKSYFRTFLKDKIEASGVPNWIRSDEQWQEFVDYHRDQLGIELDRERMIPNASRKTGAKLLCNSLWGKFGEKSDYHHWERFLLGAEDDKILGLERKWIFGEIDITYRKYSGDNVAVGMIYKKNPAMAVANRTKTNIALASMITSHARCRLWQEMAKLGDRVIYHDTDSIIYERSPTKYNIPEGRYLGEWEDETGNLPIMKFVSTGPKCYSYAVKKPDGTMKEETKIKGITLTSENSRLVNFESMKQLVVGELQSIPTNHLTFKYNRNLGEIHTVDVIKQFIFTYKKGDINREPGVDQWKVYPFGYDEIY